MISLPSSELSLKGVSSIRETQMKTQGEPTPRSPSLGVSEQIKEEITEHLLWFCWWQAAKHQQNLEKGSFQMWKRSSRGKTHCWERLGTHTALGIFFPPGTSGTSLFGQGWSQQI